MIFQLELKKNKSKLEFSTLWWNFLSSVKYEIEILTSEYDWSSRFGFQDTVFFDFLNILV